MSATRPSLSSVLAASVSVAALTLAATGAVALVSALDRLKDQSRIELAMTLQRQFDSDYKLDRADIARAYLYPDQPRKGNKKKRKTGLEAAPYDYVMDFFDDVGYLVERGAIDDQMAQRYFAYYLDNYFAATQKLLREGQKKSPHRYEHVFTLVERWRDPAVEKPDLDRFFDEELDFAEPAPAEGPRT